MMARADTSKIEDTLRDFATDERDEANVPDLTGLNEMVEMMTGAKQVMAGAVIAGFSEDQAFQFARDYFSNMMLAAMQRQS